MVTLIGTLPSLQNGSVLKQTCGIPVFTLDFITI
jgi:hypothetical protein